MKNSSCFTDHFKLIVLLAVPFLVILFAGISSAKVEYVFLAIERWEEFYSIQQVWAIPRVKMPDEDSVAVKPTTGHLPDSLRSMLDNDTTFVPGRDLLELESARLRVESWIGGEE